MLVFAFARLLVRLPKKRRRMNSRKDSWGKLGRQYFSPFARDTEPRTKDRLRCCGTHCHDQSWSNDSQLRFQPGPARCDLARVWFLMNPAFAAVGRIRRFLVAFAYESNFALRLSVELAAG